MWTSLEESVSRVQNDGHLGLVWEDLSGICRGSTRISDPQQQKCVPTRCMTLLEKQVWKAVGRIGHRSECFYVWSDYLFVAYCLITGFHAVFLHKIYAKNNPRSITQSQHNTPNKTRIIKATGPQPLWLGGLVGRRGTGPREWWAGMQTHSSTCTTWAARVYVQMHWPTACTVQLWIGHGLVVGCNPGLRTPDLIL